MTNDATAKAFRKVVATLKTAGVQASVYREVDDRLTVMSEDATTARDALNLDRFRDYIDGVEICIF